MGGLYFGADSLPEVGSEALVGGTPRFVSLNMTLLFLTDHSQKYGERRRGIYVIERENASGPPEYLGLLAVAAFTVGSINIHLREGRFFALSHSEQDRASLWPASSLAGHICGVGRRPSAQGTGDWLF